MRTLWVKRELNYQSVPVFSKEFVIYNEYKCHVGTLRKSLVNRDLKTRRTIFSTSKIKAVFSLSNHLNHSALFYHENQQEKKVHVVRSAVRSSRITLSGGIISMTSATNMVYATRLRVLASCIMFFNTLSIFVHSYVISFDLNTVVNISYIGNPMDTVTKATLGCYRCI